MLPSARKQVKRSYNHSENQPRMAKNKTLDYSEVASYEMIFNFYCTSVKGAGTCLGVGTLEMEQFGHKISCFANINRLISF